MGKCKRGDGRATRPTRQHCITNTQHIPGDHGRIAHRGHSNIERLAWRGRILTIAWKCRQPSHSGGIIHASGRVNIDRRGLDGIASISPEEQTSVRHRVVAAGRVDVALTPGVKLGRYHGVGAALRVNIWRRIVDDNGASREPTSVRRSRNVEGHGASPSRTARRRHRRCGGIAVEVHRAANNPDRRHIVANRRIVIRRVSVSDRFECLIAHHRHTTTRHGLGRERARPIPTSGHPPSPMEFEIIRVDRIVSIGRKTERMPRLRRIVAIDPCADSRTARARRLAIVRNVRVGASGDRKKLLCNAIGELFQRLMIVRRVGKLGYRHSNQTASARAKTPARTGINERNMALASAKPRTDIPSHDCASISRPAGARAGRVPIARRDARSRDRLANHETSVVVGGYPTAGVCPGRGVRIGKDQGRSAKAGIDADTAGRRRRNDNKAITIPRARRSPRDRDALNIHQFIRKERKKRLTVHLHRDGLAPKTAIISRPDDRIARTSHILRIIQGLGRPVQHTPRNQTSRGLRGCSVRDLRKGLRDIFDAGQTGLIPRRGFGTGPDFMLAIRQLRHGDEERVRATNVVQRTDHRRRGHIRPTINRRFDRDQHIRARRLRASRSGPLHRHIADVVRVNAPQHSVHTIQLIIPGREIRQRGDIGAKELPVRQHIHRVASLPRTTTRRRAFSKRNIVCPPRNRRMGHVNRLWLLRAVDCAGLTSSRCNNRDGRVLAAKVRKARKAKAQQRNYSKSNNPLHCTTATALIRIKPLTADPDVAVIFQSI